MNIRKIATALALSLAAAVPAAYADQKADEAKKVASVDKWFADYDRNRDEQLTIEEFSLGKTYFRALDTDKNGILTRDEAKAALLAQPKKESVNWKKLDTNGDGYITVREWEGDMADFDALDTDGDRVLSKYDRELAKEKRRAEGRMEAYDKDKDGYVSREEWPADAATFAQRDRNRDERLTVDELMEDVVKQQ